jgi:hypothetical protein
MSNGLGNRLIKLAKRDAIDLREMITYMESFPPSTFRKAIISYLKRQLESINCTGPMISFNMDKSEWLIFKEFVNLKISEKRGLETIVEEKQKDSGKVYIKVKQFTQL